LDEGATLYRANYESPDDREHFRLMANQAGKGRVPGAKERAEIAVGSYDGIKAQFRAMPRNSLDIRCTDDSRVTRVCYVTGPELEADIVGDLPASRLADLLAEGYRKLGG
jgi:hypothetical protein